MTQKNQDNSKTPKIRIGEKNKIEAISLESLVTITPSEKKVVDLDAHNKDEAWYLPNGEFNWDAFENEAKPKRTINPHIKLKNPTDKVFSHASYAQDLYNMMIGSASVFDNKFILEVGKVYEGKVYGISSNWMSIDVDYRELVYVNIEKEVANDLKTGDKTSVKIVRNRSKGEDFVVGSIEQGVQHAIFEELMSNIDNNIAYAGLVKQMIPEGGYIVTINGIDCFMPGSLAGMNKLHDFSSIIGTDMYVVPISFSAERGTVVVSHRAYLKAMVPSILEDLRNAKDEVITGFVTGSAKFGVFCEFNGCLTGMIHINDLDEVHAAKLRKHEINPGDAIEFKVKEIISDTKITLTQLIHNDPWNGITERYKIPARVTGTVKSIKDYGMFVAIEEGVIGLLHVSELPEGAIKDYAKNQEVQVEISRIEEITKKVFLKLIS
jgi:small subunit ribosomal protein S1